MENEFSPDQLQLFQSIFNGRKDVFAVKWDKGAKSGYMPAYHYDPYQYRRHKMAGGNLGNFNDKTCLPYTVEQIAKHLRGEQFIGIYPLMSDNTSWFIVADFDKKGWVNECMQFIKACISNGIAANMERSRSGNGGHVWIFFDKPYPAFKSRKIVMSLLKESGSVTEFDSNSSFDRLFPNQDYLSGKGFGNLIALPLHRGALQLGNSCFLDHLTLAPFPDQWDFLQKIQRNSSEQLDALFLAIHADRNMHSAQTAASADILSCSVRFELDNNLKIKRLHIPQILVVFLKEQLNFANSEFFAKKKMGKSTWGTEQYFKCIEETDTEIIVPRGVTGKVLRFCIEKQIKYELYDLRTKQDKLSFTDNVQLRSYQLPAIDAASKKDYGVIVAPPGTGKTVVALKIIAQKQQQALIIVHRKHLADQWAERIESFLGIPKNEIGFIANGKSKTGKLITIALIQSLQKELDKPECTIRDAFGLIIVDECHHIPSISFRTTIASLKAYYMYGLTATPFRKFNDGRLISIYLSDVIAELKPQEVTNVQAVKITIRETELFVPFNSKTDRFETLSNILIHDSARNSQIVNDISNEVETGKKVIVLTERKEHIETLNQFLKHIYETVTLSGDDADSSRKYKMSRLNEGNYQILLTTGQLFGEGTDVTNASCLFLVYPFTFKGKMVQYIGRIQRGELSASLYDYRDSKIEYLNKMFLKRNTYYRKLQKYAQQFDDSQDENCQSDRSLKIDKTLHVPIGAIEFRYGTFGVKYTVAELNQELDFEIENDNIRPEFEVLKPFLSKNHKKKHFEVRICAEFENGKLISQIAYSPDLDAITQNMVEGLTHTYVAKNYFGKSPKHAFENNILDAKQLQTLSPNHLFDSEEALIECILHDKTAIHFRNVKYLAANHAASVFKIRFTLSPFAFVFLLQGKNQFHIVLETLNTEEATYVWHTAKDEMSLREKFTEIDHALTIIRNIGRQAYLASNPQNFTRLPHDYSDERRGFVVWKSSLEELLY